VILLSPLRRGGATALVAALGIQLLAGCAVFSSGQSTDPSKEKLADPNVGYALLHLFVQKQKNTDNLLIIRKVSRDVEALMDEISSLAGDLDKQLKEIAKQDPSIKLDAVVLPLIEVEQRESTQLERAKQFLGTTGKPFERLLLLTQSGVLTTERHITRVMREREKNPERKRFWKNAQERFDQVYAKLLNLLESQYFSP
jgi:hypothetical protein